ncbi:hypothetical protein LWC35_18915 [Pseudonocardia kujensis]|uniref:hypothetical protein n=1 Tax=Pseudonocardia kujensis TaxID=1128675 RepID=UPI001E46F57A|nr:hypothetical protein [Pseudonocardia kujensis]MCE0764958.1 hypothetical protein [Pseudonocardia kujensis]
MVTEHAPQQQSEQRTDGQVRLAELVEFVIGVDTHADTHTAALVAAAKSDPIDAERAARDALARKATLGPPRCPHLICDPTST